MELTPTLDISLAVPAIELQKAQNPATPAHSAPPLRGSAGRLVAARSAALPDS